jgi:tRNA-i(6)A37 thiotransferase enzyme MiaB
MQGCDNFCSYCIVPYVRGREISRRFAEILQEVQDLAAQGLREVVLLGQNVNSYGLKGEEQPSFAELVRAVAAVSRYRSGQVCDLPPQGYV